MPPAPPIARSDLQAVLDATEALWEDVRNHSIFVTGGTGFFGAWLLETFAYINRELGLNASLTALTRSPQEFARKCPHITADPAIRLLQGDVRDFTFPDDEFRFVVHAATAASAKLLREAPAEMLDTIVTGTQRTLEFAVSHGAQRLLLTSSGAVYGKQPSEVVHLPETYAGAPDPTSAASAYGEGKRMSELLCALCASQHGLQCAIARCWAFCGPHLPLDAHFAIGNFIRDVLSDKPIRISGDGTPTRSYLYAGDLAVWLWTMLFRSPSLVPYNVGSGDSHSILTLAEEVRATLCADVPIEVCSHHTPDSPMSRYVPDVRKAQNDLGLRQCVPLSDMIRRTATWYGWKMN